MASTINTNVASLTAQRNLGMSQTSLNTSIQRLSSGLRINSAKDDAAVHPHPGLRKIRRVHHAMTLGVRPSGASPRGAGVDNSHPSARLGPPSCGQPGVLPSRHRVLEGRILSPRPPGPQSSAGRARALEFRSFSPRHAQPQSSAR